MPDCPFSELLSDYLSRDLRTTTFINGKLTEIRHFFGTGNMGTFLNMNHLKTSRILLQKGGNITSCTGCPAHIQFKTNILGVCVNNQGIH